MPDKLKEFVRQSLDQLFQNMPLEERLKGLSAEERLKGLSAEEVVRALPPDVLEAITRRLTANGSEPTSP